MKFKITLSFFAFLLISITFSNAQQLVSDINQIASNDSWPRELVEYNGKLFFTASDGIHGSELWMYNPSSGVTTMISDLRPGAYGSNPQYLTVYKNKLYFAARNINALSRKLFAYNDFNGFIQVVPLTGVLANNSNLINPKYLMKQNGCLFFHARLNQFTRKIIKYDDQTMEFAEIPRTAYPSQNNNSVCLTD